MVIMLLNMVSYKNWKGFEWKAICELKAPSLIAKLSQMISSYNRVERPISAEHNDEISGE